MTLTADEPSVNDRSPVKANEQVVHKNLRRLDKPRMQEGAPSFET